MVFTNKVSDFQYGGWIIFDSNLLVKISVTRLMHVISYSHYSAMHEKDTSQTLCLRDLKSKNFQVLLRSI